MYNTGVVMCMCRGVVFINTFYRKGTVTVEAAYIVPVILMITIALLCVIMVGHDRGVVYIELRRYSEKLCSDISSDGEADGYGVEAKSLQRKMLICHIDYIDVENKRNKVIIKGMLTSRVGPKQLSNCHISFKQSKIDACKNVRRIVLQDG